MRRKSRVVLAILAALFLACGLVVWDVHRRAAAAIDRHEREVALLSTQLRAVSAARPVVLGEPEDGNAWDLYRQVFAGLKRMTSDEVDTIPELSSAMDEETPDDQLIGVVVATYDAELGLLRRAVRRREVDPAPDPGGWLDLGDSIRAMKFIACAARYFHRTGNDAEAVDLTLVGLAMAPDLSRRAGLWGCSFQYVGESIACTSGQAILGEHFLDRHQLESLARRLDGLLDARPSLVDALPRQELLVRDHLVRAGQGSLELASPSWRQLWSKSIMAGQALHSETSYFSGARALGGLSHYDRIEAAPTLSEGRFVRGNPATASVRSSLKTVARRDATGLMEIRLMRLAVGIAWFEAERGRPPVSLDELVPRHVPALPVCPLSGMPFRYASGKVWSPGRDGRDDGGVLDPAHGYDPDHDRGDVVWFVRRK